VGFVISFVSYGLLPTIIPRPIRIDTVDRLRHGKTYFGENKKELYTSLAAAPLSALLFSAILAVLSNILASPLLYYGALFNAFLAFFSLLPLPETLGSVLFFARRTRYFSLIILTALFLLVLVTKTILVLLVVLGLALAYWIITTIRQRKKKK
jgi:Zn-dependent protease